MAAPDCFIAAPAIDPSLPLLPHDRPKQKRHSLNERDRAVWPWVEAATRGSRSVSPLGLLRALLDVLERATFSWRAQPAS
jgi:hypothetical protein